MAGLLALAAERLAAALPLWAHRPISAVLGTTAYRVSPAARDAVRRNLEIICPERPDREELVRAAFVAQVRHYLEIFRLARLRPAQLEREITASGWDGFRAGYGRGKGAIVASAHLGPVSICGQIFAAAGYPVTLPVENETGALARSINRARTAMGIHFVQTDSARGVHRVLRRGEILAMLADRAVTGVGVRVPFFGREALLPSAHVALALRTGAALFPAFARRDGRRVLAQILPELELHRSGDHDADVRAGVAAFARLLEEHVRLAPEQWSVFEPFWER
ncbi:MAG: phosphatidylinositol mannoside acyltransferase [Candidatus Limnocylindrales bacterium]